MSVGGRATMRERVVRRAALVGGVLALLALVLLASGHWLLGVVVGIVAVAAIWVFVQARTVR